MNQVSNVTEKEAAEMMNVQEVARMAEWLRAMGMSDTDIVNCQTYIATGVGLPNKASTETKSETEENSD